MFASHLVRSPPKSYLTQTLRLVAFGVPDVFVKVFLLAFSNVACCGCDDFVVTGQPRGPVWGGGLKGSKTPARSEESDTEARGCVSTNLDNKRGEIGTRKSGGWKFGISYLENTPRLEYTPLYAIKPPLREHRVVLTLHAFFKCLPAYAALYYCLSSLINSSWNKGPEDPRHMARRCTPSLVDPTKPTLFVGAAGRRRQVLRTEADTYSNMS